MSQESGWVYLVHALETDLYKIGRTSQEPQERLGSLRTASPHELQLSCAVEIEDYKEFEKSLHNHHTQSHENKEWYRFSDEESDEVERQMINHLRREKLNKAVESLINLSRDYFSEPEIMLTKVLSRIVTDLQLADDDVPDLVCGSEKATEVLRDLNRVGILRQNDIEEIEKIFSTSEARKVLLGDDIIEKWVYISLISLRNEDLYRFMTSTIKPKFISIGPIYGMEEKEFDVSEKFKVVSPFLVRHDLRETFSHLRNDRGWLVIESGDEYEEVYEEMFRSVREHQFRDLSVADMSGEYLTEKESVLNDVLRSIIRSMARSNVSANRILSALSSEDLIPEEYNDVVQRKL
ncbi:GIY-YIG nuclease family protein [Salinibacter ruber]|uniref:GIY-YIG nuclease family protein n=1 Tax=Salinibacter ruber TaxID=146919 RepID=UPI00216747D8|nr:GIY-YIG nuclease family protein [Salinibacter ruber]MCS3823629.1 hypothetical protein [Salinibacter ruber]